MNSITRLFDILISAIALTLLLPLFLVIAVLIKVTSSGPVFFKQVRVGKGNKDFKIFKFRTMYMNAAQLGSLTVGSKDSRITRVGYFLRKYKLDELPQLFNVLAGEMSIVGPRPELRKYVDMYTAEQMKILNIKPGITDYASIEYRNENELLAMAPNPEQYYIEYVMPHKIQINHKYLLNKTPISYFKVIVRTFISAIN